jgi:hypothetical protein
MEVEVFPGEAVVAMPVEVFEHISMTYGVIAKDTSDPGNQKKWEEISGFIREWLDWSMAQHFTAMAQDEND